MSGEVRRENFADEASWLEFQANQLELARHKRQRQATQQHAEAGRDYDIIKRINRKLKHREANRRRYWSNPDEYRARARASAKRYYIKHGERKRARWRAWFAKNREWCIQQWRWYHEDHREERNAYHRAYFRQHREEAARQHAIWSACHRKELNTYLREWRHASPEHVREYNRAYLAANRDKINAQRRERAARKKAEKLARQQEDQAS